ncbi:MAG: type II toxin-antitoxin system RelE/ParE family toxin [Planctomycetes bacterium]|nr:type II toxin-antitoxin system RelE/ParE family toxin [Planctomycetota bacterium]
MRIERLAALGHELRRPEAARVAGNLYELRARCGRVNYRILFCFHGRDEAILLHGFTKERTIPDAEIMRAQQRVRRFLANPGRHTHEEERET